MPKNGFFDLFFQKIACGAENLSKTESFYCFGRARKINLIDLKKKKGRQNFRKFFENPPPLEKILDPPLGTSMIAKVPRIPMGARRKKYVPLKYHHQQFLKKILTLLTFLQTGADLAGGGGGGWSGRSFRSEFDPLTNQKVPHLVLFYELHFGWPNIKFFRGTFGANIF